MSPEATGTVRLRSDASLADLLDQLLATGVVLAGDVELGIADVPLAQIRLLAAVGSVDTLRPDRPGADDTAPASAYAGRSGSSRVGTSAAREPVTEGAGSAAAPTAGARTAPPSVAPADAPPELADAHRALADFADGLAHEPEKVQRGLVQLVLSLVELLRQLMERQAVRRFEAGSLTDEQVERVGTTLMLLQQRMDELRDIFGLSEEDLSIDLGPLGRTV